MTNLGTRLINRLIPVEMEPAHSLLYRVKDTTEPVKAAKRPIIAINMLLSKIPIKIRHSPIKPEVSGIPKLPIIKRKKARLIDG